jgi:hypothetical protein
MKTKTNSRKKEIVVRVRIPLDLYKRIAKFAFDIHQSVGDEMSHLLRCGFVEAKETRKISTAAIDKQVQEWNKKRKKELNRILSK